MEIPRFETEHFFGPYEFTVPHLLSVSDCESVDVGELLRLAGREPADLQRVPLHYSEPYGHPELRRAIAATYTDLPPAAVMVLGTPVEGIYITMRALLEPGDEVVVLTPCYDALRHVPAHIGATVHALELRPGATGWTLDLDALSARLGPSTRLVVVNFPHNPTGFQPDPATFDELVRRVESADAWLFCDEMYRGLEFGPAPALPSAVERSDRAVVLSGLSKAYGLPGLRSGWLACRDRPLQERLENWKYYTSICAAAPVEFLAAAALAAGATLLERNRQQVAANVARAAAFFASPAAAPHFTWRPPQAGSVALLEVAPTLTDATTRWCHRLAADPGVLLLPGSCLGASERFVRLGFGRAGFAAALAAFARVLPDAAD